MRTGLDRLRFGLGISILTWEFSHGLDLDWGRIFKTRKFWKNSREQLCARIWHFAPGRMGEGDNRYGRGRESRGYIPSNPNPDSSARQETPVMG